MQVLVQKKREEKNWQLHTAPPIHFKLHRELHEYTFYRIFNLSLSPCDETYGKLVACEVQRTF